MPFADDAVKLAAKAQELIDTFTGKKKEIDTAVAAAVAAVPEMWRVFYVDQITGLDTNPGATADKPLKTIQAAVTATPNFGGCEVRLLSDYVFDYALSTRSNLTITGSGAVRKITVKPYGTGAVSVSGGIFINGNVFISINNVSIIFAETASANPIYSTQPGHIGFIRTSGVQNSEVSLKLSAVTVTAEAGYSGFLMSGYSTTYKLVVDSSTFPADFAGKYMYGIPAGADAATKANVLTTLKTL